MSRAYRCKGFDYEAGQPFAISLDECRKLVKRAHFVTRVSTDALLKDKQGKAFAELYDAKKALARLEEEPK